MFRKEFHYPLINFTFLMILFYLGFSNLHLWMKIFLHFLSLFLPFVLGFLIAYAIYPLVSFLEKKRVPHWLAIFLVVVGLLASILGVIFTIFPILYQQIADFTVKFLRILEQVSGKFSLPSGRIEVGLVHFFNQILQSVGSFTTTTTIEFFSSFIHGISQFMIGSISFIYFLVYMKEIRRTTRKFLQFKYPKLYSYFLKLDMNLFRYLKSLGLLMLVQFLEYSGLFLIIGHPHWLILGVILGAFTIIPYVGGFLGSLIAILTAFMISDKLFYLTLFVCIFFPFLDEYLISPRIYGKSNDIHPVVSVFLLSIGGSIGGVLGIILAIPIYLFFRTTISFFWKDMKKSALDLKDVI